MHVETRTKRTSDAGLSHLASCSKLEILALHDTEVTDTGLVHLSGLTKLKQLTVYGTLFTDDAVEHLGPLQRLEMLLLDPCRLTREGKNRLHRSLPNAVIATLTEGDEGVQE